MRLPTAKTKNPEMTLLDCPHCGSKSQLKTCANEVQDEQGYMRRRTVYRVSCAACGCGSDWSTSRKSVIAAWNRRVSDE